MSHIYIGIGGWVFDEWRGTFYPQGLSQKKELEYASSKLTSIEVNGTYYGSQKPETFAKWREETPEGFVFTLKGPRFATNRKVLSDGAQSIERFFTSGLLELKEKLGPINWQFMATKKFEPEDFEGFLKLLPKTVEGHAIRHAVEVRHESFQTSEFIELLRAYGVAVITGADSEFPEIADLTAPFAYVRIMGTQSNEALGYAPKALDDWAGRLQSLAKGEVPASMKTFGKSAPAKPHDVFAYVISGHKVVNPTTAMELIRRV